MEEDGEVGVVRDGPLIIKMQTEDEMELQEEGERGPGEEEGEVRESGVLSATRRRWTVVRKAAAGPAFTEGGN